MGTSGPQTRGTAFLREMPARRFWMSINWFLSLYGIKGTRITERTLKRRPKEGGGRPDLGGVWCPQGKAAR